MPLTIFSNADFVQHFRALGLQNGDDVILHSKLTSFGLVPGGASSPFDALQEVIGKKATIVVPTYCFQLSEKDIYDPMTTPSDNMGVISEYVRKLPNAVRSACPIHNHSAIGDKASQLLQIDGNVSFGPNSDFAWLATHDFKLVLLGCGFFEAGTQAFHAMASSGVPYREWRNSSRKRRNQNGSIEKIKVKYYARNNGELEDITLPKNVLLSSGKIISINAPVGSSHAMRLNDLRSVCDNLLQANPNSFLKGYSNE